MLQPKNLQIGGFGLSFPGQSPIVRVGGNVVAIKSLPAPTDQALTVTLPADLDAGPQVDVRVTLNGRTSTPLTFTVNPWLAGTKPIRTALDATLGAADLTLVLTGSGFSATPQAVRFDGPGGVTSVTVFDPGGTDTQASIDISTALANDVYHVRNGVYHVRIVKADSSASNASNAQTLEILPCLDKPVVVTPVDHTHPEAVVAATDPMAVHRLTVNGARLGGVDLRLVLDGVTYVAGKNDTAIQFVYTLGRKLSTGPHRLALSIDGQMSRTIPFEV